MSIEKYIKDSFYLEFDMLKDKFDILVFPVTEIPKDQNPYRPGIYIFFKEEKIWKVGKSNDNAVKRALQHFKADTGFRMRKGMKRFENDPLMQLALILLKNKLDLHWVLALECFLETKFSNDNILEIHSARL